MIQTFQQPSQGQHVSLHSISPSTGYPHMPQQSEASADLNRLYSKSDEVLTASEKPRLLAKDTETHDTEDKAGFCHG